MLTSHIQRGWEPYFWAFCFWDRGCGQGVYPWRPQSSVPWGQRRSRVVGGMTHTGPQPSLEQMWPRSRGTLLQWWWALLHHHLGLGTMDITCCVPVGDPCYLNSQAHLMGGGRRVALGQWSWRPWAIGGGLTGVTKGGPWANLVMLAGNSHGTFSACIHSALCLEKSAPVTRTKSLQK